MCSMRIVNSLRHETTLPSQGKRRHERRSAPSARLAGAAAMTNEVSSARLASEHIDPTVGERREQMKAIKTSVGMLLAAMVMVAGCSRPEHDDPRTQPALVRVTTVSDCSAGEQSFTGVVTARVQSDLGF